MFTQEFLKQYNKTNVTRIKALAAIDSLKYFELEIPAPISGAVETGDSINKEACNFILHKLPDTIISKINITNVSGASITDIMGKIAFNAQITVFTQEGNFNLSYNQEENALYWTEFTTDTRLIPLFKSCKEASFKEGGCDSWIRVIDMVITDKTDEN